MKNVRRTQGRPFPCLKPLSQSFRQENLTDGTESGQMGFHRTPAPATTRRGRPQAPTMPVRYFPVSVRCNSQEPNFDFSQFMCKCVCIYMHSECMCLKCVERRNVGVRGPVAGSLRQLTSLPLRKSEYPR